MKRDRWDLERKPPEGPRDQCKTHSFIRSRVEFVRTQGDGCMSVEAGKPKHKRYHHDFEFDKNAKEVEDSGVASSNCMPTLNCTNTNVDVKRKEGGSSPPPEPHTVSRAKPLSNVSGRISLLANKSFHITAVLKRKSWLDDLVERPRKLERTQCRSSGVSSAHPVKGSGSSQTPPDAEVAHCTKLDCLDSNCLNCDAKLSRLSQTQGVQPTEQSEHRAKHSSKRARSANGDIDGDAHSKLETFSDFHCTDMNCTNLDCTCNDVVIALNEELGLQPIQPSCKRTRTNNYEAAKGQGASSSCVGFLSHTELQSAAAVAVSREDLRGLAEHFELGPKRSNTQHVHTVQ